MSKGLKAAIESLRVIEQRLEAAPNQILKVTTKAIEQSAEATATKTAGLLQEKFKQADRSAQRAADRYDRAARGLGWRLGVIAGCISIAMLGSAWMLVQHTIPSSDEIATMERQIILKTRDVEALNKLEEELRVIRCKGERERPVLCVETDESVYERAFILGNRTYRPLKRP